MEIKNETDLITVMNFTDYFLAEIAQVKLKDNGIVSYIEDENVVGLDPSAGVDLKVQMKDAQKAREIILDGQE
jgi:hypothetical protein